MARGARLLAALLLALAAAAPAARAGAPTAKETVARAREIGVGAEAQQLRSRFLPGYRMLSGGEDALGATRIGGEPDLAPSTRWPRCGHDRLSFLMQVRLTDIGVHRRGTLALFADLHENDDGVTQIELFYGRVKRNSCVAVRYSRGQLARRATPRGVRTLRAVPVRLRPTLTVPEWELAVSLLGGADRPDPFFDRWERLMSETAWGVLGKTPPFRPIHQLLGWSSPVQADPTTYCDGKDKAPRILLMQLDYDGGIRFAIGDGGALYVTIRPGDLREARFNRLCAEFQEG